MNPYKEKIDKFIFDSIPHDSEAGNVEDDIDAAKRSLIRTGIVWFQESIHDPVIAEQKTQIQKLEVQKAKLVEAIKYFVKRVEAGEIRSVKTYTKYKTLLEDFKIKL
jgi:hypothetical protein